MNLLASRIRASRCLLRVQTIGRRVFDHLRLPWVLGATTRDQLKLTVVVIYFVLRQCLGLSDRAFRVSLCFRNRVFPMTISCHSDLAVLREVFVEEQYRAITTYSAVRTIVDLGANLGASSIYLALHNPTSSIYALEADPRLFSRLESNTKTFPNIRCANTAIAECSGTVDFFLHPQKPMSSSFVLRDKKCKRITVNAVSLDDLMDTHHIDTVDLLKFDIEGAEYRALQGSRRLKSVRVGIGEIHFDLIAQNKAEFEALINGAVTSWTRLAPMRALFMWTFPADICPY